MKLYQVDMRSGNANYAALTLFLFSKSDSKPTQSQINTCLKLIQEEDLTILGIDDGASINDYDFGVDQINAVSDKLIPSLKMNEVFYIIDAFDPRFNAENILNENGKIVIIAADGTTRHI